MRSGEYIGLHSLDTPEGYVVLKQLPDILTPYNTALIEYPGHDGIKVGNTLFQILIPPFPLNSIFHTSLTVLGNIQGYPIHKFDILLPPKHTSVTIEADKVRISAPEASLLIQ